MWYYRLPLTNQDCLGEPAAPTIETGHASHNLQVLRRYRKRGCIAAWLPTATAINHLDRRNLPVAISEIRKSVPLADAQYSQRPTLPQSLTEICV